MAQIDTTYSDSTEDRQATSAPLALPRFTVETALYVALFVLGFFLRVYRLGVAPLAESEALQALAALRHDLLPAGGSPLLYNLNTFLFALFSPSDGLIRLLPALAGSLLVMTPMFFRSMLGRLGALGASFILALSPVAWVASRSLNGETVAVLCAISLVALAQRYLATRDVRSLLGASIVLGVGLASGAAMYSALVSFGAAAVLFHYAMTDEGGAESPWSILASLPNRGQVALGVAGGFVVAATGAFTNLAGLGAASDLLTTWLNGFAARQGSLPFEIVLVLLAYELFALLLGLGGALRGLRRAERFGVWLSFVTVVALSLVMLRADRQPIDLLLPVTCLALLGGYVMQPWLTALIQRASLAVDGAIIAAGAVVAAVIAVALLTYAGGRALPSAVGPVALDPLLVLLATLLVLPIAVGVLLYTVFEVRAILRAGLTLLFALLALGAFAAGWGATQVRVSDAREIILGRVVTAPDVRNLTALAEQVAIRAEGMKSPLPIAVEVDDAVVAWYMRDAFAPPNQAPPGVITRLGEQPQVEGSYVGARFTTRESWDTSGFSIDEWVQWLVFRNIRARMPQTVQEVTLWERPR